MMRRTFAAIAAVMLAGAYMTAQSPARDTGASRAEGSAIVSGIVVSDARAGQPVRRAIVTIRGSGLAPSRSAITDDEGRFAFTELPKGRFTLTAARSGYLTSEYGARRPGRPGVPIALEDGQTSAGLVLTLPRGGVITGTITSGDGQPVPDIQVTVFGAEAASVFEGGGGRGGGGTTRAAGSGLSDDRGVYRVHGLRPGTYIIVATPRVTGVGEMASMPEAEIDAALQDLQRRGAGSASAPGSTALPARVARSLVQPRTFAFAPVYFPGTAVVSEAATVVLDLGEERTGADIQLSAVPTATISGTVVGTDGQPAGGAQLSLTVGGPPLPVSLGLAGGSLGTSSAKDGTFTYNTMPPGVLRLVARKDKLWGVAEVTMSGEDIAGITIALQPTLTLSGQIVFDSSSARVPTILSSVRLTLTPASRATTATAASRPVQPGGGFEIPGIVPGTYRLDCVLPSGMASVWTLRSAVVKGRDVLDEPLEMRPGGDVSGAVLTVTDRHNGLSGVVRGTGAQVRYSVIVFPSDRALWHLPSRRVRLSAVGNDGGYFVGDLPAGEYLVAALPDAGDEDQLDAARLESLARDAVTLKMSEGAMKTQDLRAGAREQ